ncbi:hypothetical protein [Flavobacterium phage V157]|uniref:Terminase, large subunit n=12 Tax=Ficleduovirus FCV1 TaxID=2560474 RepID=A0A218M893_9CAUD|nr:terminase large subunit [Flavobacterium phage FCV-1]ASD51588.1 hypothetical protein [Flavobacterium phage FCV-3]ASD51662.1 hypothetical protein [Flavobacterium phage FCV-11]ASD51736.1 hypothetical protein [Flavobacterium phage V175]ASD51814.1 hypothetical protein [Flavobacterium phage V181]ASD52492.1 hypothetical protein [Flavobacterium phage FCV-10]ASD52565.1 hypothetical protein [Flavobacterium phage FCV-16]ASD52639.1 hypothetical protein [Flavobacterium phage FCV-20]ASD52712.1 hypothe
MLQDIFLKNILSIQENVYKYNPVKLEPTDWIPENVFLTREVTQYPGYYSYELTPYIKEIVECLSPSSDVEMVAVMKNNQSGFTMGVIIPYILYLIKENPCNIMFLSGTDELMQKTVRRKLDPVLNSSGIMKLIKAQDTRKRNNRTGNTDFEKQFAGGNLAMGSYKVNNLRMESAKIILADEFDVAPYSDKEEGNIRMLLENRTTSYPKSKKLLYLSTPTVKGASNVEQVYLMGDQRHWHWNCPHCNEWIDVQWAVKKDGEIIGGIKFEVDDEGLLVEGSTYYQCQHCKGKIFEKEKAKLNKTGKWIPTTKPKRKKFRSYQNPATYCFDSWDDLAMEFLAANPKNGVVDKGLLKAFVNTKLAQTWEEEGKAIRVSDLMNNTRSYEIGIVPDQTCENDGNGKIVLITLACDLGGIMNEQVKDVRLDWEIQAHSSTGVTYNINHGSIGTFKRSRTKSKQELDNDTERIKYTYDHGDFGPRLVSVWPELKNIISRTLKSQSGKGYNIDITVIDTSYFTKLAYDFIQQENDPFIVGIKGYKHEEYVNLSVDTPIIKNSLENKGKLFILQVNKLKDILADNIRLKMDDFGYQPRGYMNFPQPEQGKYTMKNYFKHLEAEHRVEEIKGERVVGFMWKKKNDSLENHFWDVNVYNLAAREIFIKILRKSHSKYAKLTFEMWATIFDE